jgi:predicted PurR-regulated permease PerM
MMLPLTGLSSFLLGFLGALLAIVLLALLYGLWLLWTDHLLLRQVVGALNQLVTRHPELFK